MLPGRSPWSPVEVIVAGVDLIVALDDGWSGRAGPGIRLTVGPGLNPARGHEVAPQPLAKNNTQGRNEQQKTDGVRHKTRRKQQGAREQKAEPVEDLGDGKTAQR